jgi:hypothetical protein
MSEETQIAGVLFLALLCAFGGFVCGWLGGKAQGKEDAAHAHKAQLQLLTAAHNVETRAWENLRADLRALMPGVGFPSVDPDDTPLETGEGDAR